MALYVTNVGFLLLGRPHPAPHKHLEKSVKDQTFERYLLNLRPEAKQYIVNAINTFPAVLWAEKAVPLETILRKNIIKEIIPIVEAGKIPEDLDYSETIDKLGIGTKEHLELALFDMLQDIGIEELKGN